ncbi:hypothetical protein JW879_09705 [candidate division WOR-3 bacterium]|nr:hypothetical protein [candidate division WOR-3 bacterium]
MLLTIPIIILYLFVIVHLWELNKLIFTIYCSLFVLGILFQSYCCAYQRCPYIGKFCPGLGGFIIPASIVALLLKKVKKVKSLFDLFASLGFLCLLGIIILPIYFIYKLGVNLLIFYSIIVIAYSVLFLVLICPVCAIRDTCPAGKASSNIYKSIKFNDHYE